MKATSLLCFLLLCAGAAQSQTVFLDNPSGDDFVFIGAEIAIDLWLDFPPPEPVPDGAVNVFYDNVLTSFNRIDLVLPLCPAAGPCVIPGTDDGAGTISGITIEGPPGGLIGTHHVATLVFDSFDIGTAVFKIGENATLPFLIPVTYTGVSVDIVGMTCSSGSLPEPFDDLDASSLPAGWDPVFVNNINEEGVTDSDGDGIPDNNDNCIDVFNPDQLDTLRDGHGDICDADFNADCIVNFSDLAGMQASFFSTDPLTDLNGDGVTNFIDLAIMRNQFFGPPGPSGLPTRCNEVLGWRSTADPGYCDFGNVTDGAGDAACLQDQSSRGLTVGIGPALCTNTPLSLLGADDPKLELNVNFQPGGLGGVFKVVGGTLQPGFNTVFSYDVLYETSQPLGAFESLPGELLTVPLPTLTPYHVCVIVEGQAIYTEVDQCIACALSCGGGAGGGSTKGATRRRDCGFEDQ